MDDTLVSFPMLSGDAKIARQITGRALLAMPSTCLYSPDERLVAMQVSAVTHKLLKDFIVNYTK